MIHRSSHDVSTQGEVQTVTGLNLHMIPWHSHLDDMFTLVTTYEYCDNTHKQTDTRIHSNQNLHAITANISSGH